MSLLENHSSSENRMTLDKRTFQECSRRMQRLTPTLPRKHNDTRSRNVQWYTSENLSSDSMPIAPPRKRRNVPESDITTMEIEQKENQQLIAEDSTKTQDCFKKTEIDKANVKSGEGDQGSNGGAFMKRPVQCFMNWMSCIANNVQYHDFPPS